MSSELKSNLEGLAAIVGERSVALSPHEPERIVEMVQRKSAARTASMAAAAAAAVGLVLFAGISMTLAAVDERAAAHQLTTEPSAPVEADAGPVIVAAESDGTRAGGVTATELADVRAVVPGASGQFAAGYVEGLEEGHADGLASGAAGEAPPGPPSISLGLARDVGTYDDGFQAGYELGFREGFSDGVLTRERGKQPDPAGTPDSVANLDGAGKPDRAGVPESVDTPDPVGKPDRAGVPDSVDTPDSVGKPSTPPPGK